MKLAVISDIHGNLPAFKKALEFISNLKKIDKYIFLGDIVGYGPWSNECVEIVKSIKNCIKIKGNHEEYFIKGECDKKNVLAQNFFDYSFKNFNQIDEIKKYKESYSLQGINFSHTIENKYIYKDSKVSLKENLVIGHSHHQFKIENNNFCLINPGSIGQNRNDIKKIEFAILDTNSLQADFYSKEYDYQLIINEMKAKKYPDICVSYYLRKLK